METNISNTSVKKVLDTEKVIDKNKVPNLDSKRTGIEEISEVSKSSIASDIQQQVEHPQANYQGTGKSYNLAIIGDNVLGKKGELQIQPDLEKEVTGTELAIANTLDIQPITAHQSNSPNRTLNDIVSHNCEHIEGREGGLLQLQVIKKEKEEDSQEDNPGNMREAGLSPKSKGGNRE